MAKKHTVLELGRRIQFTGRREVVCAGIGRHRQQERLPKQQTVDAR